MNKNYYLIPNQVEDEVVSRCKKNKNEIPNHHLTPKSSH